jgi:hypothetical protein
MNLPTDPITWLKVAGAVFTALGSILLAWRVKEILKWVVYCLVAHEQSIAQLRKVLSNEPQTEPMVQGVTKHLLNVQSKLGVVLLVVGLLLVAAGMLFNAATYLLANP